MFRRGLPSTLTMRHDLHYVEELAKTNRAIGKIIPISEITPNPKQPRTEIGDLTDLVASIKEKGVLEPLLVKPLPEPNRWMIIAGERRWRASNLAGLKEVPCIELDIDEKEIAEIALIENLQRKDLTVWEEADGLASLVERFGYTHDEIAKKISKSRSTVTELISVATLPSTVRLRCVENGINTKSVLLQIGREFDAAAMLALIDKISSKKLSSDQIKDSRTSYSPKKSIVQNEDYPESAPEKNYYSLANKRFSLKIVFKTRQFDRNDIIDALRSALEKVTQDME